MGSLFRHPLWLVGFRPFFTLAFLTGALLPPLWALVFSGRLTLPAPALSPLQWHAHEMFFGFGWAVLGGFLLTASKNWVHIRGLHGGPLALAVALWFVERFAVLGAGALPAWARLILLNAFLLFVAGFVVVSLVRYRKQDTFPDNSFFVIALPAFLVAKNLILFPETFVHGTAMALGLFRVAFVVMFERTLPPFMAAGAKLTLVRKAPLDFAIKALALLAVLESVLPARVAAALLLTLAVLLTVRFFLWRPDVAFKTFGVGVMYAGYAGLTLHLGLEALRLGGVPLGVGSVATHAFTFLCMGIVIPAMLIRISQGHTARPLKFTVSDRLAIGTMGVAAFFRLLAPQLWPAHYLLWVTLAGVGWTICFSLLGFRLAPFLWKARLDGKEH
ncbi:MAG: nnrS [Myxococcaceae bacterium]|nr:nnrS [Myxococcaceae bacterium]